MAHGWEGDLVRLVPLDAERHLENALRWVNDPEVTGWLLIGDTPMARGAEREWLEATAAESSRMGATNVVFAIETLDGAHIGTSGIHHIDYANGVAHTGSYIGEKGLWGRGYGTDSSLVRAAYCFDVLGLRLLCSAYLEGNERSRRMSEKAGYREVGRWPKRYWKRGAFRDEVLLALEREAWEAGPAYRFTT